MGKIIMIGAMKGGVGKSVTVFNLAYSLQKRGKRVLAVDFDPQSNLTTCFGAEEVDVAIGDLMMNVIEDEDLPEREEYIWERNGVDFIPASIGLSAVEAKLRLEMGTEKMLAAILEPLRSDYDVILIDTSPSLGALNINAMAAADEVIVTVNPQLLAMKGLQDFLKTVKKIKSCINDRLDVAGILLTMCDARTILCKTITEEVQEAFHGQLRIFKSKIPNTVKVGESVYYSEPLIEYAPESNACKAYERLAGGGDRMKANAPKRKIFDAVDMMTADAEVTVKDGVQMLPIDSIRTFHDHPFRLYEGAWLNEMVESIKECGVLNPVIVRKAGKSYEMLSGHNRQNAARIAGLTEIPAIVKEGLSDEEAYVYVIETNLIQRSFADLLPSERAAVLEARYNKVCCQGKRNDIIRELQVMSGETPEETCGHNGHKLKSRDALAEEYGYSSRNVARYLRINNLIGPIKDLLNTNRIAFWLRSICPIWRMKSRSLSIRSLMKRV